MHYLWQVPKNEQADHRPTDDATAVKVAFAAATKAFWDKLASLDTVRDESGTPYGDRLLSYVMLNVLDEKWKDHLYDLDQLRNSIHYRSWGQQDPLIEYKQEAYKMFVDLMNDIYNTFSERFLKVQLMFDQQPPGEFGGGGGNGAGPTGPIGPAGGRPKKRYNALGILEDVPLDDEAAVATDGAPAEGTEEVLDIAPSEPPKKQVATRRDPVVVGAGRARSVNPAPVPTATDWTNVGRNDPCPCG